MSDSTSPAHHLFHVLALLIAAGVLHTMLALGDPTLAAGGLLDNDAYLRLIRIEELWASGDWYGIVTQKLGAPDGLSLHWTRPLDLLILLPALAVSWFGVPLHDAIYWVGVAIAPLLQTLTCLAVAWAAKPVFPQHGAWRLAALMLLLNGAALSYSLAGRPDHHPLSLVLIALMLGYAIRAMLAPERARPAYIAGAMAGAGVWVTPESLLITAPILIALGLLWFAAQEPRAWSRIGIRFGLGMALVLVIAIGLEQPPQAWLQAEYDKVSILHLALALAVAIDFRLAAAITWRGWRRAAGAFVIVLSTLLLLNFLFPYFYLGPLGNIDDASAKLFMAEVTEMRPMWPVDKASTMWFFSMAGNALAAIPAGFYFLWKTRRTPLAPVHLMLAITFTVALLAAMMHTRLAVPMAVVGAILGCGLFVLICDRVAGRHRLVVLVNRLAGYAIVILGLQLVGMLSYKADMDAVAAGGAKATLACDTLPLAAWLNANRPVTGPVTSAPIILTDSIDSPPPLAYLTGYRFVGGPYHRGNADVADMLSVMTATDDGAAGAIIARRQVSLVLICLGQIPQAIGASAPDSLYHRLASDTAPAWLVRQKMSEDIDRQFRLFAVQPQ
jgi:hypothetical protein